MKRRDFLLLAATTWPPIARAQSPDDVRRVGVLMPLDQSDPENNKRIAALQDGLHQLGWLENRNLKLDLRTYSGEGDGRDRSPKS